MAIEYEVIVIHVERTLLSSYNPEIPAALGAPCEVEAHFSLAKPQLQVNDFFKEAVIPGGALHAGGD